MKRILIDYSNFEAMKNNSCGVLPKKYYYTKLLEEDKQIIKFVCSITKRKINCKILKVIIINLKDYDYKIDSQFNSSYFSNGRKEVDLSKVKNKYSISKKIKLLILKQI